ncbi:GSCOCT00014041001.2-RA-CDS [Cotesia congregata]|uniref:Cc_odve66_12 n=1 Tax=Cotesia congregata TaxID=51543 RepID=A0A8J2HLW4_COTCN|nr:GSCOCT00014041001.2-RA-CDS [Cotesia congregata]CAG5101844.1 Cc_odve66_12 [Cotesia congregata]
MTITLLSCIIASVIIVFVAVNSGNEEEDDVSKKEVELDEEFVEKITNAMMIEIKNPTPSLSDAIDNYLSDRKSYVQATIATCTLNVRYLKETLDLNFEALQYYAQNTSEDDYKNFVTDHIKKIYEVIMPDVSFTVYSMLNISLFTGSLLKLLAMYEYVVQDETEDEIEVKKTICHSLIIFIVPKLNTSFTKHYKQGPAVIYINIPRLLTNYRYDRPKFCKDMKNRRELRVLKKEFELVHESSEEYNNLIQIIDFEFYDNVYQVLFEDDDNDYDNIDDDDEDAEDKN